MDREFTQYFLALRGERQKDFAAVVGGALPAHVPAFGEAIGEFHGAVVLDLQSFCEFPDAWPHSPGQSFECQH